MRSGSQGVRMSVWVCLCFTVFQGFVGQCLSEIARKFGRWRNLLSYFKRGFHKMSESGSISDLT